MGANCLLKVAVKASQPRYQITIDSQLYGLGDDNSVVKNVKRFPKIYKSNDKRGVAFVRVTVCKV